MRLLPFRYAKCRFFAQIKSQFFKKLLLFFTKGSIMFYAVMKVQSDILCAERRRSVQAVHRTRESPLSERAVRAAGSYPLPYGKRGRPRGGNLGGNTESFRPIQKGEKGLFILRKADNAACPAPASVPTKQNGKTRVYAKFRDSKIHCYKGDTKCLI